MSERAAYLRDGDAIYQRSFAIIRAEADLSAFSSEEADIVVRMIHACGLVEAARHIGFGGDLVSAARRALAAGAPILVLEAMKMEHKVVAPARAIIKRLHVAPGAQVDLGAPLVSLKLEGTP